MLFDSPAAKTRRPTCAAQLLALPVIEASLGFAALHFYVAAHGI